MAFTFFDDEMTDLCREEVNIGSDKRNYGYNKTLQWTVKKAYRR
jgi:hypothetical protein